jgi:hypothetical protein
VPQRSQEGRGLWWWLLAAIVVCGLLSRMAQTGLKIFDKYLGDALYAAMVYVILRLTGRITRVALWSAVAVITIELFQLTGLTAEMFRSGSAVVRVCARLLGTQFSVLDLLAYAVGIAFIAAVDHAESHATVRAARP